MHNLSSTILFASLFLLTGCGETLKKMGKQIEKGIGESLKCIAVSDGTGSTFEADQDIKLYIETINAVRDEIRNKKGTAETFWTDLSNELRHKLNFELNVYFLKNRISNPLTVYRATAYFFNQIRNNFNENTAYKFKDNVHTIHAFSARGKKTTKTEKINFTCTKYDITELRNIPITAVVYQRAEIKDMFECRTEDKQLFLMEVRDMIFVSDKQELYSAKLAQYKKTETKRKIKINLDSEDIQLELRIKKKREAGINGIVGHKSEIELRLPTNDIEGKASCDSVARNLDP